MSFADRIKAMVKKTSVKKGVMIEVHCTEEAVQRLVENPPDTLAGLDVLQVTTVAEDATGDPDPLHLANEVIKFNRAIGAGPAMRLARALIRAHERISALEDLQ